MADTSTNYLYAALRGGVATGALILAWSAQAGAPEQAQAAASANTAATAQTPPAQTPPAQTPPADAPAVPDSEIVVTGSRIQQNGFASPTPVTVASSEQLTLGQPASLNDGIVQLPQFNGSFGPGNAGAAIRPTGNTGTVLNLRGVGSIRTLILLDGIRVPPTSQLGLVNVDIIPQQLVKRVDTVTAGASAAYGSDAVSGVVNFVIDSKFKGLKLLAQRGIATRGDNGSYQLGAAGGFDVGGRGHLVLSAERRHTNGLMKDDRPAGAVTAGGVGSTGVGTLGSASNPIIYIRDGLRWNLNSNGGRVTSGPFLDTVFLSGPNDYRAAIRGTALLSPGYYQGGDYFYEPPNTTLLPRTTSNNLFGRFTYDVTDSITATATGIFSRTTNSVFGHFNDPLNVPIYSGNAYLPAALQAQLTATNTPSFTLSKFAAADGPIKLADKTDYYYGGLSFAGKLFGDLTWNADYNHGESILHIDQSNLFELRNFYAAIDAVDEGQLRTGVRNGNIVCRVAVTNPGLYPGCVPYNDLGFDSASAAAKDYVTGTASLRSRLKQDSIAASVQGSLIDLWAGSLSFAAGAEYRKQSLGVTSNSDPNVSRPVTGIRGLTADATRFYLTTTAQTRGSYEVKEGFLELSLPLIRDASFTKSLELNGAVRYTDYSTSGNVTTWKVGAVWAPIEDIRFRVTRSRDIRAPTLYDLFLGTQPGISSVFDIHTSTSSSIITSTQGNPDLRPEVGSTLSAGVVIQPSFLPRFGASIDFYKLKIKDAIGTLTIPDILQACEQSGGSGQICGLIVRPGPFSDRTPANTLTSVNLAPVNAATLETQGVDFEANYRAPIGAGSLAFRLYASYIDKLVVQTSPLQAPVNYAGWGDVNPLGSGNPLPKTKGTFSLTYTGDSGLTLFVQERMIGKLKRGSPISIVNEPGVPTYFYTDATISYALPAYGGKAELFVTANNLFDRRYPFFAQPGAVPGLYFASSPGLYDVVGTNVTVGVRMKL
ncbi:TonB-dependent receptor [Sphingomonas naphthae]|uniref:TonB-dependent receptor n=1 Tax=Sphingomonas naphthae TaxID=1813468 RepID=A0ABY7TM46_9SPHN|nr:TonB-dependent receptor [Sphingomonas naphthae]WCT73767.1 TonB-dependent receptor [Sphingomonas naphthae]